MPKPTVLPYPEYAPEGASIQVPGKTTVCDALLEHGVEIEPACGKVGACTTCHVLVASGFDSLNPVNDNEEDMLDRAW
jgi:2Fe-2S ferredoxin